MIVLGLTGSVGMGKTTAAREFHRRGVPVFHSDDAVHDLLSRGGAAVAPVAALFPRTVIGGAVDRQGLGALVFRNASALRDLEAVLHPLVQAAQRRFLQACARRHVPLVLLDIPLLYETGAETRCDAVAVTTAPPFVQARRVLSRPGMDRERYAGMLARQMPDTLKRRRADFIILTGLGRAYALHRIAEIIRALSTCRGTAWSATTRHGSLARRPGNDHA